MGHSHAGVCAYCRRRCVVPDGDGTSFEARRLRGRDLCFGPALAGSTCRAKVSRAASSSTCRYPAWTVRQLQTRLSELGSTLPIIFLTGYPDIPTTVRAIKAGADDFLTKPVSSDDLLQAIERAFAHHQTLRELKSKLDVVRARIAALTPRERRGLRTYRSRQHQQAGRPRVGRDRAHHQGPSPQGDGENAGPILGGTCLPCRTGRRCVGCRTDRPRHLGIKSCGVPQSGTAGP